MAATTFEQLQRMLRGKALPPIPKPEPTYTLDPVEIAAQNFQAGSAPIRTELYGNGAGALDIANRRPILPDSSVVPPAPSFNIGPSPRPNMPPEAQEIAPSQLQGQGIPQIPPVASQVGAGEAESGLGGYVPLPPPTRRELPMQLYSFPSAPQAPTYQAAPQRNLEAERGSLNRGTLTAGLIGLLAGGAPGALAAASGYQGAGQKSFDSQFGQQAAQVEAQNALLGNQFKGQLGQYDSQLDAIRMRMTGDDRDAALIERENADKERAYNQGEGNRIRVYNAGVADRAKGEVRKILQQRANTGDMNAQTNLMGMLSIIDDRKQKADLAGEQFDFKKEMELLGYDFKTQQFNWQKQYQGTMAEVAKQNADTNELRARISKEAGDATRQIQRERMELDRLTKSVKGSGSFTPTQQLAIDRELGNAEAAIMGLRNRAGKAPDVTKDPAGYAQWAENRRSWESAAQEKRKFLDTLAEKSGYKRTATGYEKITPVGAPRTQADPGYDAARRGTVKPYSIPIPPNSSGRRELTGTTSPPSRRLTQSPVINPSAQAGNRPQQSKPVQAQSRPAPAPRPVSKPKRDMSKMSDAELQRIAVGGK